MRKLTKPITKTEAVRRLKLKLRADRPGLKVVGWRTAWEYSARDRAVHLTLVAYLPRNRMILSDAWIDRDLLVA